MKVYHQQPRLIMFQRDIL
ncbi:hypothetical protein MTR67_044940 [Solanum verrucosum]|uniref:Uncharacterized protein n=1 Tax=Solanum verrucosum TaxID=315347 RepID=A0AAF0UT34_SOLVR|nr:hypothetical protein MTR67_044940 [Solanum verrucosum]